MGKGRARIFNILTLVFVVATIAVAIWVVGRMMQPPPAPPTCAALDFDDSGSVSVLDVAQVAARWGETSQTPGWDPRFDLDANLVIDAADITIIAARWGEICP